MLEDTFYVDMEKESFFFLSFFFFPFDNMSVYYVYYANLNQCKNDNFHIVFLFLLKT